MDAVRLVLEEGWSQGAAARRVKAAPQSVSRWVGAYRQRGEAGLRQAGRAGRKPLLDAGQLERTGPIETEYLPPDAPELNPVEYIWAYWKQHELPNVCPKDYGELSERARKALRRMRRKPRLITAFWKQSSLCFD